MGEGSRKNSCGMDYGVPFVSKLKMMLVFTIHAGIYEACRYLHFMLVP